ncbi:MAG: hypothetical protein QM813_24290 [Verrucomicrobiota bacterium]
MPGFSPELIWNHSLQVATLAQIISLEETKDAKLGEAAFTSGLMTTTWANSDPRGEACRLCAPPWSNCSSINNFLYREG